MLVSGRYKRFVLDEFRVLGDPSHFGMIEVILGWFQVRNRVAIDVRVLDMVVR